MPEYVTLSGPLFNGLAEHDLEAAMGAAQRAVAAYAEFAWQAYMTHYFRFPSDPPQYQSHVNILKRGGDLVVNDGWPGSGLKYGPWLEGIGSRNSLSGFKGYRSLQRAAEAADKQTEAIVRPIVDRFISSANGV